MRSFRLKNVKAFKDTQNIELAPITIFVGQNSCGKSSFIRFPAVLSQTVNSNSESIALYKKTNMLIDYGTFDDVVYKHIGHSFAVEMTFDFDVLSPDLGMPDWLKDENSDDEENFSDKTRVVIEFTKNDEGITISRYVIYRNETYLCQFNKLEDGRYEFEQEKIINGYGIENIRCKIVLPDTRFQKLAPVMILENNEISIVSEIIKKTINPDIDDPHKLAEELLNSLLHPVDMIWDYMIAMGLEPGNDFMSADGVIINKDEINKILIILNSLNRLNSAFIQLREAIEKDLSDLRYIGPFRSEPERIIRRDESWNSRYVGNHGEMTTNLLINDYLKNKNNISSVSEWCNRILKCQLDISAIGHDLYELLLKKEGGMYSNIMDVGFGVSQVLPIITQVVLLDNGYLNAAQTIIVEQPELHLHPNAQAELASLFVAAVKNTENRKILIETHSEHLIRGLQLLIANINDPYHIKVNNVKIYYVHDETEKQGQEGSWIEEMKMDKYGQFLSRWPKDFFDKSYSLTKEFAHAIRTRSRGMSE